MNAYHQRSAERVIPTATALLAPAESGPSDATDSASTRGGDPAHEAEVDEDADDVCRRGLGTLEGGPSNGPSLVREHTGLACFLLVLMGRTGHGHFRR